MGEWGFLTSHARVLLHIAHDPGARLRDIAASLGITERRAHGIITDLAEAGYVITQKDGRRNPLPGPGPPAGTRARHQGTARRRGRRPVRRPKPGHP
jgi:predicted ArsR family transcriptional regulator